jgi:exopolysaccharide biosynthesis polyprenyl glycosylphosphotransferase
MQGALVVGSADISRSSDDASTDVSETAQIAIDKAVAAARRLDASDIVILTDWSHARASAKLAEQFLDVPAAVHLQGLDVVEQFAEVRIAQLGTMKSVVVRPQPMSTLQSFAKRFFDVVAASLALLFLAPIFAAVALAIRMDSPGPALFLQRRRGFNHKEFRIYKFRTMTTRDDGANIVQATANDPRITRVGRVLRKYNLDELPQLVNVLLGDMSLVGPRPHAVAHDGYYEQIIQHYGRRLNVKPGITGWAQVNGLRGETKTKAAMQARVTHDLHYIDNWSIAFDIYVLILTVISKRAYANAI